MVPFLTSESKMAAKKSIYSSPRRRHVVSLNWQTEIFWRICPETPSREVAHDHIEISGLEILDGRLKINRVLSSNSIVLCTKFEVDRPNTLRKHPETAWDLLYLSDLEMQDGHLKVNRLLFPTNQVVAAMFEAPRPKSFGMTIQKWNGHRQTDRCGLKSALISTDLHSIHTIQVEWAFIHYNLSQICQIRRK